MTRRRLTPAQRHEVDELRERIRVLKSIRAYASASALRRQLRRLYQRIPK